MLRSLVDGTKPPEQRAGFFVSAEHVAAAVPARSAGQAERCLPSPILDVHLGAFTRPQTTDIANLSRWAFLLTFAGIGLRTDLRSVSSQGWGPLVVGIVGEVTIAVLTLGMVLVAASLFQI